MANFWTVQEPIFGSAKAILHISGRSSGPAQQAGPVEAWHANHLHSKPCRQQLSGMQSIRQNSTSYLHVGKFQNDNWCWCFGIFQGWEFALWFFVQITCFLRAKQKCNFLFSKWEYCSSCSSFCKGGFSLVTLFKRVTEVNAIFYKEWEEQWWAIHSFVLGIKREKAWRKEWIWNESLLNSKSFFHKEGIASVTLYFMYDNIISCGSLQKE